MDNIATIISLGKCHLMVVLDRWLPMTVVGEVVNYCFTSLFGTNVLLSDIVIRLKRCSQLMRWMMFRWWCEGGGDRAWWVIKSVFLRSPDKGFWACLGDLPLDMPRRPETWVALVHDGTSLIMCPTSEHSSMCTHKLLVYRIRQASRIINQQLLRNVHQILQDKSKALIKTRPINVIS